MTSEQLAWVLANLDEKVWPTGPELIDSQNQPIGRTLYVRDYFRPTGRGGVVSRPQRNRKGLRYLPLDWEPTEADRQGEFMSDLLRVSDADLYLLVPDSMPDVLH